MATFEREIIAFLIGGTCGSVITFIFHAREYDALHNLANGAHDVATEALKHINNFEAEVRSKLKI